MRILAGHDGGSGCAWYRLQMPLTELGKHGHRVTIGTAGTEAVRSKRGQFDVIVGQMLAAHDQSQLSTWRRLSAHGRLVYEIDDDPFSVETANWQAYSTFARASVIDAVTHSAEVADLVTVTTEPLARVMRKINPDVAVLPNYVPGWVCDHQRPSRDRLRAGWAGGSSHGRDIQLVTRPLREFLNRNPGWDAHLYGTDFRPAVKHDRAGFTPWVNVMENPRAYYTGLDFDVGLAPLQWTVFASSKCVDSSMRISTNRGVLEADDLESGMKVWRDGWRRIEAVQQDAPRPGFLFRMEDGYQLKLTPEHRMLIGGEWKPASQIQSGDVIAMEAESAHSGEPVRIPWPADGRMSRAYRGRAPADPDAFLVAEDGPKLDITPRWGRFLGAFAGDGSVGQATVVQISCDGQDQDWIDLLMDDLRAFGLNPRTEEITTFDGTILRRRGVRVASAHLLRVLASIGVTAPRPSGNPIRVPCVPEVIWRSPKPVVAEFLAGYFEADGHCTTAGVNVVSKDERLIRDVQRLLLLFGITSTVRSRIHSAQNGHSGLYWHCTLRRLEAEIFAKEIGFRSQRKMGRLSEIVSRPHSNGVKPMRWSRRVALVERCFVTPVDIQVEGSVFVLAGFVSHNSYIKALEYAALGIPVIASDAEPYRDFVVPGVTGFLVRRDHEWLGFLQELASDEGLRLSMGAKAREHARAFTIERNYQRWADAYGGLL